jgi:HSP20 family protein
MAKDSRGFFEKLTGARILDRGPVQEDDDPQYSEDQPVAIDNDENEEEYLEEATEEEDVEPEDNYSDEDTGEEEEEREGQLTVDVFQDDTNVVIQSTIAGVSPDDLDVSITNDMVTIRGERRQAFETDAEDYFYQECYWGTFSRSIILPVEIDADRAEAKIKNGILTIRIPKANAAMTRKLKVKES